MTFKTLEEYEKVMTFKTREEYERGKAWLERVRILDDLEPPDPDSAVGRMRAAVRDFERRQAH